VLADSLAISSQSGRSRHSRSRLAKGERAGEIPYGYALAENGVNLVPDALEAAILADLRELRAEEMSWQEIADAMNAPAVTTKKGRPCHGRPYETSRREERTGERAADRTPQG